MVTDVSLLGPISCDLGLTVSYNLAETHNCFDLEINWQAKENLKKYPNNFFPSTDSWKSNRISCLEQKQDEFFAIGDYFSASPWI